MKKLNLVIEEKKTFNVKGVYTTLRDGAIVADDSEVAKLYPEWFSDVELTDVSEVTEKIIDEVKEEEQLLVDEPVEQAELTEVTETPTIEEALEACENRDDINDFVKENNIEVTLGNLKDIKKLKAKVLEAIEKA